MSKVNGLIRTLHPAVTMNLPVILMLMFTATFVFAGGYGNYGKSAKNDIVDTAISAGNFNTLLTAAQEAGLVDTLKGDGPFTLFAPTDEAFAQIPADKLDALLKDKQALTKVLTYHLIRGKVTAGEVVKLESAKTVEGRSIAINTGSGVRVNDANVIKTDIMASNGVIHVIDKVIMPN